MRTRENVGKCGGSESTEVRVAPYRLQKATVELEFCAEGLIFFQQFDQGNVAFLGWSHDEATMGQLGIDHTTNLSDVANELKLLRYLTTLKQSSA